jgi:hypothetical protein
MIDATIESTPISSEVRWTVIEAKIAAVGHLLQEQGSVSRKRDHGKWLWRLRYFEFADDGRRVQRTVYLTRDPGLADRARQLVAMYRGEWARKASEWANLTEGISGLLRPLLSRSTAARRG